MTDTPNTLISLEKVSAALEALPAAFVVYDADDRLLICNESYKAFYHPCEDAVRPGVSHEDLQWLKVREGLDEAAVGREKAFVEDEKRRHKEGPEIEEWEDDNGRFFRMMRVRMPNGMTVGMRFDISDLRAAQLALETQNAALEMARVRAHRQATRDDLTGLTNRRAASVRLAQLKMTAEQSDRALALLHVDLDGFKQINDGLGHDAGDKLLIEIARRLRHIVRRDDLLARIGGDEFVIAMVCGPDSDDALAVAQRIVDALQKPVRYDGRPCTVGASVGIAIECGHDINTERLMKSADLALYKAKEDGRNQFCVFDTEMHRASEFNSKVGRELVSADLAAELRVFYQPIVRTQDFAVTSAEALVRWDNPRLGLLTPDQFLPVADGLKLMGTIDDIVLRHVLDQRKRWLAMGVPVPVISVNVSSQRLRDPHLLPRLKALDLPPGAIVFEVLETVFSEQECTLLKENIDGLARMGVEMHVDDYGTAHSSISGLLLVRPTCLKIDRRFIETVIDCSESQDIVRLTCALGHALGIAVTCEGVETLEQAQKLTELECDQLQGYYFGKPVPAEEFFSAIQHRLNRAS